MFLDGIVGESMRDLIDIDESGYRHNSQRTPQFWEGDKGEVL
jgi:hypothetical protein